MRVLVVDDHRTIRDVVRVELRSAGLEVVGVAADGAEAVTASADTQPDVVVMDVRMPRMDGVESTRRILESGSAGRVVILTGMADACHRVLCANAGASAFLSKASTSTADLVETVRSSSTPLRRSRGTDQVLGDRQLAILQLMAEGASSVEVAATLNISAKTVHNHLSAAYRRLGVQSNVHAVVAAVRLGLIQP